MAMPNKKFEGFDSKNDIFELIDRFEKSSLLELDISMTYPMFDREVKIKMSKSANGEINYRNTQSDIFESDEIYDDGEDEEPGVKVKMSKDKPAAANIITAPLIGTFYSSPSPDSEPYVKVGDKVAKGTVVCIIEAMKTMNEIESEADGEIAEILADNAAPVEYGQPLFRLK